MNLVYISILLYRTSHGEKKAKPNYFLQYFEVLLCLFVRHELSSELSPCALPKHSSSSLPVLVGGSESLWWPFYFRHIPLSVLMAGRGDFLSEGGSDWTVAVPDRLLPEPSAGREPRTWPVWLDGRDVRQRGERGVDGQRGSEVRWQYILEGINHNNKKNIDTLFHRFCSHLTVLSLLPLHPPTSLQVSAPSSLPPVSRGRSQEGAAHPRHPSPAGGLPVAVLDFPQGEKRGGVGQRSQHGDGLLSPPQLHRHRTGASQVAGLQSEMLVWSLQINGLFFESIPNEFLFLFCCPGRTNVSERWRPFWVKHFLFWCINPACWSWQQITAH